MHDNNHKLYSARTEKLTTRIKAFCASHPLWCLSFLLFLTAILVFWKFLLGKATFIYADIGCDTKDVYYPFFTALNRKLAEGDYSMWEFSYGFGANIITRQADFGSPFTWLVALGGQDYVRYAVMLVHILKIILAGYGCYAFVGCFKVSSLSRVLVSYVYAFNGFTLLWGQHYFFSTASLHIIISLYAIEKILESKKYCIILAGTTFLVMVNSYYLAYMVLLFTGIYALIRLIYIYSFSEIKSVVTSILSMLGSVILGAVMSAAVFLPSITYVMNWSSRLSDGTSVFDKIFGAKPYNMRELMTVISRIFSNNLLGTDDYMGAFNYYEAPEFFFTGFILIFAVIFCIYTVIDKEQSLKSKVIKLTSVALIAFLCLHPSLSIIFNGFTYAFFRYSFLLMPLFALLVAFVLDKIISGTLPFGKLQIAFATIVSVCVIAASDFLNHPNLVIARFSVLFLIVLTVVLGFLFMALQDLKLSQIGRFSCCALIVVTIALNVTFESHTTTNNRVTLDEFNQNFEEIGGNDDVAAAVEYLEERDKGFYRIDKNFLDVSLFNDSMLQGYYPASAYNSVVNKNQVKFAKVICPEFEFIEGYYDFSKICKNSDVTDIMGVKYILSIGELNDVSEYKFIKKFGDVNLYENTLCDGVFQLYGAVDNRGEISSEQTIELPKNSLIIESDQKHNIKGSGKGKISINAPENSSIVSGKVYSETDNYLYAAIPYEDGWEAFVDGKEVDIIKANVAFSAIELDAGNHNIEFRYTTPMLDEGLIISSIGIIIFASWFVLLCINEAKRR